MERPYGSVRARPRLRGSPRRSRPSDGPTKSLRPGQTPRSPQSMVGHRPLLIEPTIRRNHVATAPDCNRSSARTSFPDGTDIPDDEYEDRKKRSPPTAELVHRGLP